jgi:hypothetical protein
MGQPAPTISTNSNDYDNAPDSTITIHVPAQLPALTVGAARAILGILVELTTVEILDGPPGRFTR